MSEPSKTNPGHATPQAGESIGAYVIDRKLGSGGMADVFFAIHQELNRPAAIKVLRASLATDEVHLQRFMQEARAAAALIHPNIVQVYDVGRDGEYRYIAQEYVPGSNLRQYLTLPSAQSTPSTPSHASHAFPESRMPEEPDSTASDDQLEGAALPLAADRQLGLSETLSILLQVLAALTKSAASGIVHRDIKPENIMLTVDGDVKVADFGLARILLGDDPQLTRAGTTLGTPMYMSPEQIQDGTIDIRSDLYSLGVTLYHMLAGRPPFTGETPLALAMQHVQAPLPDIRRWRPALPDSLVHMLERMLAKSPDDRFANPRELLTYLREHRDGDLAKYWPEQTVPLPGASAGSAQGPMRATLLLQQRLRKQQARMWTRLLAVGVAVVGMLLAFGLGSAVAYKPLIMLAIAPTEPSSLMPEREATARDQYLAALLSPPSGEAKWRAVEHYFPVELDDSNRNWIDFSRLQIARVRVRQGNIAGAEQVLRTITNESAARPRMLVIAWLQLADIGVAPAASVAEAKKIYSSSEFLSGDRQLVDDFVKELTLNVQSLWSQ